MSTKLAGYTPLREMLQKAISAGQEKLAAATSDKTTVAPVESEKVASDSTSTVADNGIDHRNPEHMDKLASALEDAGEKIAAAFIGGESKQGGETLTNGKPVPGKQSVKKDPAASKTPPNTTSSIARPDAGPAATLTQDTLNTPTTGKMSPKVMKTASERLIDALTEKTAFGEQEKRMGGETLDSASGQGTPATPANGGNAARKHIASNTAPAAMKKVDAKVQGKKDMAQVLTEPMMSASKDHKVQDNLRNASKGGVKIAAAKALVEKIAAEGCKCESKGECRNCVLLAKIEDMKSA